MSALSAMVLMSGISNTYAFDWFEKGSRVNIQSFENRLQVDVFLLRPSIVTILSQNHQITVFPLHYINIPLQAVWSPETDIVPSETECGEIPRITKDGLMPNG